MKKIISLSVFVCYHLILLGQNQFIKGYIIQNEGDTLKGYIQNMVHGEFTEKVVFKTAENSAIKTYLPRHLKGFVLEQDNNKTIFKKLPFRIRTAEVDSTFYQFGKALLIGYSSIYRIQFNHNPFKTEGEVERPSAALDCPFTIHS